MPSTYTANGGIELPANGEQSATWGSTVNDNMSILDRITNGVGSISLAGTTHTLPTTDGTLSDGQNRVLVLGGSPSGPNTITVTPNNGQHIYIIKNLSGQTATFTQGSGSNVSVLNGTTKIIYCDGGGGGAAVVDLTATFDLGSLVIGGNTVTASAAELNIMDGVTATTAEINIMDGVTATTAELNIMDGVTATTAEINIMDGVTATTAEINIMDGVTATTAELNIMDGVTATTAEINIMDGVTATTAEINIMDGVTATTAELNYVDGVTSPIQTQLEAKAADTTQDTATWEAGSGTEDTVVSPAKVKAAIQTNLIGDEGAVGTYAFLGRNSNSGSIVAGSTYAGSVLQYAAVISVNSYSYNTALTPEGSSNAGTWRAMGTTNRLQETKATVFLRIS